MTVRFNENFLDKKIITIEGNVVSGKGVKKKKIDILRKKGVFGNVDSDREPDIVIENGLIFPGFVDLHVHARNDSTGKWKYKEDFTHVGKAALSGGVTAIADMPNTPDPLTDEKSFIQKYRMSVYSGIDILLYAGIGPGTKPIERNIPYKLFMGKSVGELYFKDDDKLEKSVEKYRGKHVSFHCEDPGVLAKNKGKKTHAERRPPEAEITAVEKAIELVRDFNLKGKFCHVSTKEGIMKVKDAKNEGLDITIEVTPHHLLLEDNGKGIEFPECLTEKTEGLSEIFYQVNPPVRSHYHRKYLFSAFKKGEIDFLATDHAPHTLDEKKEGISGMPHLDSYGMVVGCLMEMGVKPSKAAETCSIQPGSYMESFGFPSGEIIPGGFADLAVLYNEEQEVKTENLFTKCKWSPFQGKIFPWRIGYTVKHGRFWDRVEKED